MSLQEIQSQLGAEGADMVIVYDGQCVFCSNYVKLLRLRSTVGRVEMIDARRDGVSALLGQSLGLDLNSGMLVLYQGRHYHGPSAMTVLSLLSGPSGTLNRALASIFRHPQLSSVLYPVLRLGRAMTLALLGRRGIVSARSPSAGSVNRLAIHGNGISSSALLRSRAQHSESPSIRPLAHSLVYHQS